MSDLIATSLSVAFGPRPLFDDVSLTIDRGNRVALVGPNGAGKTTLLRVLSGDLMPKTGDIRVPEHLVVALHDQRPERTRQRLRDFVAPKKMVALEARLRELELEMASGDEAVFNAYDAVRTEFDVAGGDDWPVRVEQVLRGLGFVDRQLDQPLDSLSGGELTRASLARALASAPDILLLDEPTNHLDMSAIDWLQAWLADLPGGVVIVSHDRWFIEEVCTSVIEIAEGKARHFNGSFVDYRAQQAMEAVTHQRHLEKWKTEIARLQRFVDRFGAGTRSRQATARAKTMEKLKTDAPQLIDHSQRASVGFSLPAPERTSRTVLDCRGIELGFAGPGQPTADDEGVAIAERTLLLPQNLVIEAGEKVVLLGRNGTGKSTFLHGLAAACISLEKAPPGWRGGEVRVGYGVSATFVSQHDSGLREDHSLIGNMQLANPSLGGRVARSLLGLFGFTGDDGERLVQGMSGGERRRLMLAMSLTGSSNLLLLDEPTNHLDIETREALEAAVADFGGTVILISHDRALIEGVATRCVVLHDQQLIDVPGGYAAAKAVLDGLDPEAAAAQVQADLGDLGPGAHLGAFSAHGGAIRADSLPGRTAASNPKQPGKQQGAGRTLRAGDAKGRSSQKVAKPKAATAGGNGKRVRRPSTIEREIEEHDAELAKVQALMLDPDVYTSPEKSAEALERNTTLERRIARLYDELESAMEHHGA